MTVEKNKCAEREGSVSLPSRARQAVAITAGSLVLLFGALALCGWLFNVPAWRNPLPGPSEVKFNTAVCHCFAALSLLLRHWLQEPRWTKWLARALALVPLITGALTAMEHAGLELHIDEVFFRDSDRAVAGRMALPTAFSFILAGLALLCISDGSSWRNRFSQILAGLAALFPMLVLIAGVYGTVINLPPAIYNGLTLMSFASALALCFLAGGIILAMPDSGLLRFLFAPLATSVVDEAGFRRLLRRVAFWPVAALVGVVLVLLGLVNYLLAAANQVDRGNRVLTQISAVEKLSVDMETGLRGYQLTGDSVFLEPYDRASAQLPGEVGALEKQVSDSHQTNPVARLRRMLDAWTGFATNARDRVTSRLPLDATLNLQGKALRDGVRRQIDALQAREQEVLTGRVATLNRVKMITVTGVLLLGLAVAPLLAFSLLRVNTSYREMLAARDASEGKTRATLESITDGLHIIDGTGRLTYFNGAARKMFAEQGVNTDPLLSRHLLDEAFPAIRDLPVGRAIQRALTEHVPTEAENFFPPWQRWYAVRNYPTPEGGVATYFQDITERRQNEARIAADLEAMTQIYEVGSLCAQSGCDYDKCIASLVEAAIAVTRANKGNMQLLDEASGDLKIVAHRGFTEPFLKFFARVQSGKAVCGTAMRQKARVIVEDVTQSEIFAGQPALDVLLAAGVRAMQSTPLVSGTGQVLGMISTHFDAPRRFAERELRLLDLLARQAADYIQRVQAEETLRQSEERFRVAVDAVSDIVWTNNAQGEMEGEQPGWGHFTGQTVKEYQGYGWSKTVHPDDVQPTIDAWKLAVAEKRMFQFEHRVRRHDGQWRSCAIRALPVIGPDGAVREWVGVHTDITERKIAEEALRQGHAELRRHADELSRFNRVAVGRELRMIEMKKEVNSLRAQLSQAVAYPLEFERAGDGKDMT